jgi:prevent-host-death family protein
MCYMSRSKRVGVRELRQHLSVYLLRVVAGETLEVTDRGRTVALLSPLHEAATPLERLKAQGRVSPTAGDLLDLGVPRNRSVTTRLSKSLGEIRDDRL